MLPTYAQQPPSAAAELVSSDRDELLQKVILLSQRLNNAINRKNTNLNQQLSYFQHRLAQVHPEQQLRSHQQKSDELNQRLKQAIARTITQAQYQPEQLQQRLLRVSPSKKISMQQIHIQQLTQRLINAKQNSLLHKSDLFVHLIEQLNLVSPLATIARGGYGVIRDADNKVINSCSQVATNNEISVQVADGSFKATVI